ncbi:MAG: hypothetical protein KKB34_05090 [Bacteroidetes bacterium]|nr:hypothetical protein [Bacteroidota bacterium]
MAKAAGIAVKLKIGATPVEIPIFDPELNENADELDVSDNASGGSREYLSGLISREISFAQWFRDDATNTPNIGDTVPALLIAGTKQFDGDFVVFNRKFSAKREEATRWDFSGKFTGAVTFSGAVG